MSKIKITPEELLDFPLATLEIDSFWYDLYGIAEDKK